MNVGARIKELRLAKGLTIQELSAQSGLSVGFISNVEREKSSPTVSSLERICVALETNLVTLFGINSNMSIVMRKDDSMEAEYTPSDKAKCTVFAPTNKSLQPCYITLQPGGHYGEPSCHAGDEICAVLDGTIVCTAGTQSYVLDAGDLIFIEGMVPHSIENKSDQPARTLWVTVKTY